MDMASIEQMFEQCLNVRLTLRVARRQQSADAHQQAGTTRRPISSLSSSEESIEG